MKFVDRKIKLMLLVFKKSLTVMLRDKTIGSKFHSPQYSLQRHIVKQYLINDQI